MVHYVHYVMSDLVFNKSIESGHQSVVDRQKAYTRSLPRTQLNLNKRGSGAWSKPPTPGPYSPTTSDTGE